MTAARLGSLLSTVTSMKSVFGTAVARTGRVDFSLSCTSRRTSAPSMRRSSLSRVRPGSLRAAPLKTFSPAAALEEHLGVGGVDRRLDVGHEQGHADEAGDDQDDQLATSAQDADVVVKVEFVALVRRCHWGRA